MTGTITLSPTQTEGDATLRVSFEATAHASSDVDRRQAPLFVPRKQTYYWTLEWQHGEAEALREIAEGRARRFASGAAAAEWLLSDDD